MTHGTISFCVGTGRNGTSLLSTLAGHEPAVAASHERFPLAASYHMFCKWHGIDSDAEGFLHEREDAIAEDLRTNRVSFEASALLSHSIAELHERFNARFLMLVRRPDHTVASFASRGWFKEPIPWRDRSRPPTIPDGLEPREFFGRNFPRGTEFDRWERLTQIGRIAWFWQARNRAILEQFHRLPPARRHVLRIEDLDYARYSQVAQFLGWTPSIGPERFGKLAEGRLNTGPNPPLDSRRWTNRELAEFMAEVADVAQELGYRS